MPESLCRVVAPYVSCGTFAISAIGLQSQQSDCNPPALQLDCTDCFELQNRTAILDCSGLHLDYTDYPLIALDCIVLQSIL